MGKITVRHATAILLVVLAAVVLARAESQTLRPQYGIELEVTPAEGQERAYDSVVIVRNTKTRLVVAQPKVHSIEGKPTSSESSVGEPAMVLKVTVEIGEAGKLASYVVELRDHDGAATSYKAQVHLEKP
jgi:hypothetical protein